MHSRYVIVLDLSGGKPFSDWKADPADMATVFARWVRHLEELAVYQAHVICPQLPGCVHAELSRSPRVFFHPPPPAGPQIGPMLRAVATDRHVVLLTGGTIWIEPLLDEIVNEHREAGRRVSICPFHAGFSPIIISPEAVGDIPGGARSIERQVSRMADDPASGVVRVRRQIPNMNLYARPDCAEGWECLAWMSRSTRPRESWNTPQKFREGFVGTRENYRRSFRAISVFRELEGARVLEIGCSPSLEVGPKVLLEEFGVAEYSGVNLDPISFEWRHPKASFHTGDAALAPYKPASFDLVFSLAVWEHVRDPGVLFHKIPEWLAPGGGHYGKFQVWSSAHGYHLPPCGFPTARQPAFCHLTMSPDELRAQLSRVVSDAALVERGVERVYEDEYINRVRAADFLEMIRKCGLEAVFLDGRCNGKISAEARRAASELDGQYTAQELSVEGLEFYLRKSEFRLADVARPASAARVSGLAAAAPGRE